MAQDLNSQFEWSKLGQREVSHFMGQELIYDFITHDLDPERHAALEKFILETKDAQNTMMKMLNGIQYVELLSETIVSEPVVQRINEPSSYLAVLLKKTNFQRWPASVKWALEALVVVGFIVMTTIFIPWDKISKLNPFPEKNEMVLAEVERVHQVGDPTKLKEMEMSQPAEFADEEKKDTAPPKAIPAVAKNQPAAATPNLSAAPSAAVATAPVLNTAPLTKMTPTTEAAPPLIAAKTPVEAATKPVAAKAEPVAEPIVKETEKKGGDGSLYRGVIAVTNLEMVGPKIRDKILELGGRKAGEVELGWQKTPQSAYFHFTLPEAKYEELNQFLATYGSAKVAKEKHPRIMPDGIIRLIITVDEAAP